MAAFFMPVRQVRFQGAARIRSKCFKDAGCAHAGADAHGHHAVLVLATAHAVDDGGGADRAGRAQRMAQAIAPPSGLTLDGSSSLSRITASACAAKASLSSIQSSWPLFRPAA